MEQFIRDVGAMTQDEDLVRGALAFVGAFLALFIGTWRLFRGKTPTPPARAKIDVPEGTFVRMGPTMEDVQ